jgi:hypothetical protein
LTAEEERILIASTIPKNTGYKQNGPWRFSKNGNVAEKIRLLGMCLQVQWTWIYVKSKTWPHHYIVYERRNIH